jgi:hypothetical protein
LGPLYSIRAKGKLQKLPAVELPLLLLRADEPKLSRNAVMMSLLPVRDAGVLLRQGGSEAVLSTLLQIVVWVGL